MATIAAILEGKTGNYFKLEDLGENAFVIIESIDPKRTEIRTEKVENKEAKNGRKETEYYHILGRLGDVEKDLSLTFTALKQLAPLLPAAENWRGYSFKYTGTKGSGKNIRYGYQIVGKAEIFQNRLPTEQSTPATDESIIKAVIEELKESVGFFPNGIFPESSIISCSAKHLKKACKQGTGGEVFAYLKQKGLLQLVGDGYKVVV